MGNLGLFIIPVTCRVKAGQVKHRQFHYTHTSSFKIDPYHKDMDIHLYQITSSVQLKFSLHYSEHYSNNLMTPSFHLHTNHLIDLSSSVKSENFSLKQISTHQISRDTRCVRKRLFQRQYVGSQKRTSSYLDDGEAIQSMFHINKLAEKDQVTKLLQLNSRLHSFIPTNRVSPSNLPYELPWPRRH